MPDVKFFEVAAVYTMDGKGAPWVVDDVSDEGALINCSMELQVGQDVEFEIEESGRIAARVVRVNGTYFGLALQLNETERVQFGAWLEDALFEDDG